MLQIHALVGELITKKLYMNIFREFSCTSRLYFTSNLNIYSQLLYSFILPKHKMCFGVIMLELIMMPSSNITLNYKEPGKYHLRILIRRDINHLNGKQPLKINSFHLLSFIYAYFLPDLKFEG